MLEVAELRTLSSWCRVHAFHWAHTACDDGLGAMTLEMSSPRHLVQRMTLILRDDGFYLVDNKGETLAAASDLRAVLDALDGGVAEPDLPSLHTRSERERRYVC